MKSFKKFKVEITEGAENNPKEYDYEGEMAKNDMHIIVMHAQHIADMMEDNTNLPEWCQSKITIAKDYLQTVCDYLHAEMNEAEVKLSTADRLNALLKKHGFDADASAKKIANIKSKLDADKENYIKMGIIKPEETK